MLPTKGHLRVPHYAVYFYVCVTRTPCLATATDKRIRFCGEGDLKIGRPHHARPRTNLRCGPLVELIVSQNDGRGSRPITSLKNRLLLRRENITIRSRPCSWYIACSGIRIGKSGRGITPSSLDHNGVLTETLIKLDQHSYRLEINLQGRLLLQVWRWRR